MYACHVVQQQSEGSCHLSCHGVNRSECNLPFIPLQPLLFMEVTLTTIIIKLYIPQKHRSFSSSKGCSQTLPIKTYPRLSELHDVTWLYSLLAANKGTKFHPHCLRQGFLAPCPSRRPDFQSPWASLDLQNFRAKVDSKNWHEKRRPRGPKLSEFPISITHVIHQSRSTTTCRYLDPPISPSPTFKLV